MDIELRHLRYFEAVAKYGGFTAAARRLHVAQQVLSAQIRQLEDVAGVVLFERTSRGVRLTASGDVFLVEVREILHRLDRAVAAARNRSQLGTGRLSVGLSVAAGGDVPSMVLSAFADAFPAVEVTLMTYDLIHPAAGLLDYETDVAFVRMPVVAEGIEFRELAREPRVFVVPSGHELTKQEQARLDDVAGQAWIATEMAVDGCDPSAWRDDWLANPRPDGSEPIIGATARTIDEWREYVVAGRGISLCPASAEAHYSRPGLAFVRSLGVPSAVLCVACRSDNANPLVADFLDVAATACVRRSTHPSRSAVATSAIRRSSAPVIAPATPTAPAT